MELPRGVPGRGEGEGVMRHPQPAVAPMPRRGLSRDEAARYVGISTTLFAELVAEGKMPPPFLIRSRKLWDIRKLDGAIDALSDPEHSPWETIGA